MVLGCIVHRHIQRYVYYLDIVGFGISKPQCGYDLVGVLNRILIIIRVLIISDIRLFKVNSFFSDRAIHILLKRKMKIIFYIYGRAWNTDTSGTDDLT